MTWGLQGGVCMQLCGANVEAVSGMTLKNKPWTTRRHRDIWGGSVADKSVRTRKHCSQTNPTFTCAI